MNDKDLYWSTLWEMRDSTWSLVGIFDEEPVRVIRIVNPLRVS